MLSMKATAYSVATAPSKSNSGLKRCSASIKGVRPLYSKHQKCYKSFRPRFPHRIHAVKCGKRQWQHTCHDAVMPRRLMGMYANVQAAGQCDGEQSREPLRGRLRTRLRRGRRRSASAECGCPRALMRPTLDPCPTQSAGCPSGSAPTSRRSAPAARTRSAVHQRCTSDQQLPACWDRELYCHESGYAAMYLLGVVLAFDASIC